VTMAGEKRAGTPSIENLVGREVDADRCGAVGFKGEPGIRQAG
jgi:hypothetical protein